MTRPSEFEEYLAAARLDLDALAAAVSAGRLPEGYHLEFDGHPLLELDRDGGLLERNSYRLLYQQAYRIVPDVEETP